MDIKEVNVNPINDATDSMNTEILDSDEKPCADLPTSYWKGQPLLITKEPAGISPIIVNPPVKPVLLPENFEFKTLNTSHRKEIHKLLQNHYIANNTGQYRRQISEDFVYWYIKYIPSGLVVGLIYKKKLVGLITAFLFDAIIYNHKLKTPYVNLLCVQSKLRHLGLAQLLMEEMQFRLVKHGYPYAYFTSVKPCRVPFATTDAHMICINQELLEKLDLWCDCEIPSLDQPNPFHLMTVSDIESVVNGLNKSLEKYSIKPFITIETGLHLLLPKKDIVYTFVKRDSSDQRVTDMINIYQEYTKCMGENEDDYRISVARVGFIYHETVDINDLFICLIDKLPSYGFDQLIFRKTLDTVDLDLDHVDLPIKLNHHMFNIRMVQTNPAKVHGLPLANY